MRFARVMLLYAAILVLVGVLAGGLMARAETSFDALALVEESGVDPWLNFATDAGTWGGFVLDESDANAVCLTLDMPTGSATVVPVLMLASGVSDYGYFAGQVQPALAIEDLAGTSWIRLSFSGNGLPVLSVGGVATGITIPAVTGYAWTDDVDLAMGAGTDVSLEFSTADANAHYLMVDLPTGAADSVPVMGLVSADADLGYFNGVVEPTLFVENLAGTSYVSLDHSGTTLARLVAGGAATELRLVTPAGADIILDGGDAAAGTGNSYVTISGTTAAHAGGTPTDIWLDINPTIGINTAAATQNIVDLTFASPAWATAVATNLRGIYFAPTIGNATAGTNVVALMDVAAITGDASVSLYGLRFGALTGTGATEDAISIGAGWDNGLSSASPITGTLGLTVTGAAVSLNASSNFAVNIATGTSTGAVTIGGTAGNVIGIGNDDTTADTISMGSAKDTTTIAGITVSVGSTGTTSALTLQSGTGDVSITSTDAWTATCAGIANLFANAVAQVVTIGNETGVSALNLKAGTGNINVQGVAATTITIGDAAQTGVISIGASTATMPELDIGTGVGAHTIHIGDGGTAAQVITMGSTSAASAVTIQGGTGDVTINSTDDVKIADNAVAQDVYIGNETAASSLHLLGGTGNIEMQGVAASTITIGDAAQTARIAVGESTATMTDLSLGTGVGAHTIHIGDGGTAAQVVTMGSTSAASAITIQAGSGDVSVTSADDWTATALGTVNLFASAAECLVTLGNSTGASSLSLLAGTGNINIEGVAASTITIGDAAQTARIAVGESTATMTDLSLGTGVGAHTIHLGDGGTAAQVITMGSTSAASAITIQAGSGDVSITSADDFTTTALGTVNLFASAAENLITLGSNTTASAVTIQGGTGDVTIQSTDDILIASDAVAQQVTIGNTTGTSSVTVIAGSGGVQLPGAAIANTVDAGAVVAGTCTAVEYNVNGYHKTVLTLLGGTTFSLEDKDDGGGIKIYDFPQGVIVIESIVVNATITLDTNVTAPYVMSVGTVIGVDSEATLTTTEANYVASTAVTNGVAQDFHGVAAAVSVGLIGEPQNGTSSPPDLFVNAAIAAGSITGAGTLAATGGTITILWSNAGDF